MVITPHLLIGAAIGAKVKNLGWIIVLGIISHIILDRIPHWDYGKKIENLPRDQNFKKIVFATFFHIAIDGLIGLIIISLIVWQKNMIKINQLIFIFVGIFASLFLDFTLGITKLFYHKSQSSKKYVDFHHEFLHHPHHIKTPASLLGLGTEILISLIAVLILLL